MASPPSGLVGTYSTREQREKMKDKKGNTHQHWYVFPFLSFVFSRRFIVDMASPSFSNLSRHLLLTVGFTYIFSPRCWFTDKPQSVASANRYGEHSRAQAQRSASTVFLFAIVSPQWYRCRIFYWQSVGLKPESFLNPFWALQLVFFFSFFFINSCKALWYSCDGHQQQW